MKNITADKVAEVRKDQTMKGPYKPYYQIWTFSGGNESFKAKE